jgi:AcrR family transcriptional regulator
MLRGAELTRKRLVAAAVDLFYGEGIRSVSVDAVAERAGVTKRTLYYHFKSKDDLVAAYIEAQDQPTLALFARWMNETEGSLAAKIEAMFGKVARSTQNPKWKGCGFLRTAAELADTPGHPALKAGAAHKKKFEAWLTDVIAAEGFGDASLRARQIVVLLDGAVSVMLVHRDPSYAEAAGHVAASLVSRNALSSNLAPKRHA